ncbi:MAG: helix-turn-helix domain-containing protein, partial [Dehalococcoidia bacterium]
MANKRLRAAMARNRVSVIELATYTERDPKTVSRWLAGRVPHPRTRYLIAKRLKEDEEFLWPGANRGSQDAGAAVSEVIAAYPHRATVPSGLW